jgi:anti-anti-sigma factor
VPVAYSISLVAQPPEGADADSALSLTLGLSGEIDTSATPELRRTLAEAAARKPRTLIIDVTQTTFLGLSAIGALLVGRAAALHAHTDVSVTGAGRTLNALMDHVDSTGPLRAAAVPRC